MHQRFALHNGYLYHDQQWRADLALLIDGERIEAICPLSALPTAESLPRVDAKARHISAGLIDLQVNGGGGVLFNNAPTLASVLQIRQSHWQGGTTALLPTLITDAPERLALACDAIAEALNQQQAGILGIHLEGPHISEQKKGVHAAGHIRPLDSRTPQALASLPASRCLLTIAPETVPPETIRALVEQGYRVSLGHSNASYEQTLAALAAGASGFTHLYNAMSGLSAREPGMIGAALTQHQSACGLIVDGYHLHDACARLALDAKPPGKVFLVTDSMALVGAQSGAFSLYGETIHSQHGRCQRADGTLAGSALSMIQAVKNTVERLNVPLAEALKMASLYPAEYLGIAPEYGQLSPGARADFILFDADSVALHSTWQGGQCVYQLSA